MIDRRRLTLQLTPLLDLLLIVMFAQYMELRIVAKQESEQVTAERLEITEENQQLRQQARESQAEQRRFEQDQLQERVQLGRLVRELFQIPESLITKLVQPRSQGEGGLSPSDISDLKSKFQQLANSRGDQVIDHLLTFQEMRKNFDVWEIYINENGELLITTGQDRQPVKSKAIETPEAFVDTILEVRRQFPPTRSSVLMLCRYGDCRLLHKLAMTRGLPAIADRMKNDGQGTVQFDYAVFGYRPHPALEKR